MLYSGNSAPDSRKMEATANVEKKSCGRKKKSFYQKAKKFGQQGRFGRGKEIDRETYDYFLQVLERINKHGFDSQEDQEIFVENVFSQTAGKECDLCSNQLVSRVIEVLLPLSSEEVRMRFMSALATDIRPICMDPFSSHVLQKLMLVVTFAPSDSEEFLALSKSWLLRLCKFISNNVNEFAANPYASHVLRTCFQCAGGVQLEDKSRKGQQKPTHSNQLIKRELGTTSALHNTDADVKNFNYVLCSAVDQIVDSPSSEFRGLLSIDPYAAVLQTLLHMTCRVVPDRCKVLCDFIFKNGLQNHQEVGSEESHDEVSGVFSLEPLCRTMEALIEVSAQCHPTLYQDLYSHLFRTKMCTLSQMPMANFCVQKLIAHCNNKEQFEQWYEQELDANLEKILASGNFGVVLAICSACRRLSSKQNHFVLALMKSLHCHEPSQSQSEVVPLLVQMTAKECDNKGEDFQVNLHGSLILQELLSFNKPIKFVQSILSMDATRQKIMFSDPKGSHITDAFVKSETIGEKSRDALVKSLQGMLVSLACTKHGARTVDALWTSSSNKTKEVIMAELASKRAQLTGNHFGKILASKFGLSLFQRSRDQWRSAILDDHKKKKFAADFLSDFSVKEVSGEAQNTKTMKKRPKAELLEDQFVVDTRPDQNLLQVSAYGERDEVISKPARKKAKSYLDDL